VRRLKIALDSDGLLSNFTAGALKIVEEVTGRHYEEADVGEFDFTKAIGLSVDEAVAVKKAIGARKGFAASLMPYPQARQGVRRLRELGDVFCVTSPWDSNPWWRAERESWLALHFGIDVVRHEEDKTGCEADVFVDDRSKHVRAWLAAWPGRCAVLWRTLHNANEDLPVGAHVTSSWDALYQIAMEVALGPLQQPLPLMEESAP
jgi:hypothetical protein